MAYSQNPVAANNAIKEIQQAIDEGSVKALDAISITNAAVEAAKSSSASKADAVTKELTSTAELAKSFSEGKS